MAVYSDIIKELRKDKKITQKEMSKHFGIKQSMYSMYENGTRTMKIEMLSEISDILDTSIDYLMGKTDVVTPYPRRNQTKDSRDKIK